MPAQPARDVGQDRLARLEFNREGRARKNLLDRAEEFEGCLFGLFRGFPPGSWFGKGSAARYGRTGFKDVIRS